MTWQIFPYTMPEEDGPYLCTLSMDTSVTVRGERTNAQRRNVVILYWSAAAKMFVTIDGLQIHPKKPKMPEVVAWCKPPEPYTDDGFHINKRDILGSPKFNVEYVIKR